MNPLLKFINPVYDPISSEPLSQYLGFGYMPHFRQWYHLPRSHILDRDDELEASAPDIAWMAETTSY